MRRSDTAALAARGALKMGVAISLLALACHATDRPQRLVLVTLDTVRADVFDASNAEPGALVRTRAYARHGSVFARAFAASNATQPTHASLLTGLHPWQHGVTRNGQVLGADFDTVAERLREAGFHTAAVVSAFPLERRFGFDQGFEVYREVFGRPLTSGAARWQGEPVAERAFYALAPPVVSEALAVLDSLDAPKQFLWVHLFDAHDPYGDATGDDVLALKDLRRAQRRRGDHFERELARARRLYADDLAQLDAELARLFERLRADSQRFETHVLVTADHGESFGERGRLGHGGDLGAQETQVPLFVVSPRFAAERREDVAGSIDVAQTMLALAGAEPLGYGRDLTRTDPEAVVFGMQHRTPRAASQRRPDSGDRFFAAHRDTLDVGDAKALERRAGDGESPDALRALFRNFQRAARQVTERDVDDAEAREALQALGYLR